jgi:hypothetical protein
MLLRRRAAKQQRLVMGEVVRLLAARDKAILRLAFGCR